MEKLQVQEWEATLRTHLDLVCVRVQEVSKCLDFNFKKLLVLACLYSETFFGCGCNCQTQSVHFISLLKQLYQSQISEKLWRKNENILLFISFSFIESR